VVFSIIRDLIAILATLALLVTMLVPMVGPAAAASTNSALTVPTITTGQDKTLGTLQLRSTDGSVAESTYVTFTLLDGAKTDSWNVVGVPQPSVPPGNGAHVYIPTTVSGKSNIITEISEVSQTNNSVTVEITGVDNTFDEAILRVSIIGVAEVVKTGDVKINIYAPNSGFSEGDVIVARATGGGTTMAAISTENVSEGITKTLGVVRISETTVGSLLANSSSPTSTNTIKLTLPAGFTWTGIDGLTAVNFSGTVSVDNFDGRYAYISIADGSTSTPGMIQFAPIVDIDSDEATKGDITLKLSGNNPGVTAADVIIGKYGEYDVIPSVESTPDVIAGKTDQQIGTLVLEEALPGSLLKDRTLKLTLNGNAKWHTLPALEYAAGTSGIITGSSLSSDAKTITVTVGGKNVPTTSAAKIKLKNGTVDLGADMSGDLIATLSGTAGVPTADAPVAKIKSPVTATAASKPEVKIGLQDQLIGDITITEVKGEVMKKSGTVQVRKSNTVWETVYRDQDLIIEAPNGVTFANVPTVEVTEGDMKLDTSNIRAANSDTQLIIPIKTESSKASTIKISGAKVTLSRTVPEGDMVFDIKGKPVVETDVVFKGADTVAAIAAATCVTPAPGEQKSLVVFKINDTSLTVNGVAYTMDVAPYIKDSRTFIPVRYAAQACGVSAENILFSEGKVTLIKGDKVIQLTIGSKVMIINGVAITIDVAPEIINPGRTMLPFRWVAQALGATVSYDEATQTVTMEL
jgi:hypothetical protein